MIIDAPAGIDDGFILSTAGADKAVIVTTPEYAAVRDAEMVDRVITGAGIKERCYVINKVRPELIAGGAVPSISEIDSILRIPFAGIIQYDDNIHIAANNGLPIVFKKDTYIYENMEKIVDRVIAD